MQAIVQSRAALVNISAFQSGNLLTNTGQAKTTGNPRQLKISHAESIWFRFH